MPTTIDSMTGVEIKSPFFDTAVSLELFPVHPNVLKNPNAPQKNRVALIYGSNGSGKSTIAQGFREYSESVVPKTVELNPTAGAAIIKMSSGMKSGKIFVFDEKYISRNIKVQESGLGTIVLLGEQVELEKRLEELKAQIAKLQANIDSKAENVEKFNLVSDVISPEYWKAAITKKLQSSGGWAETSGIRIKRNQIKTRVTDAEVDRLGQLTPQKDETLTREKFTELFSVFDSIETSVSPVAPEIRAIDIPEKVVEDAKRLLAKVPQKPILTEREQELLHFFGIEVLSNAKGFLSVKTHEICPTCLQMISEEHRTKSLQQIEDILNREVEECREELKKLILPEIEAEHYQCYSVLDSELLGQIILQIASVNALITNYNKVIQSKIADPLSSVECVSSEDLITAYKQLNNLLGRLEIKRESFNRVITNRKTTEKELLKLNDEIAHYVIYTEYQSFSEIAKETELQKLYHDEMFVVIDDPVSSFDVENRVGILPFLRYKLNQMLSACATTKVLMMSHDVSVIFDLQKVMDEVSANCAEVGKHAEYCSFQLVNKRIVPFKAKSHNEYTRLMKCVYEYGRNPEPTAELTIGNMTRRVLEAFSTFTFKEGPDKVSLNPQVLALIPDQNKRAYFQNSMYRLVLNTESHLQEAVQGAPEMSFFSHLTVEEKQRTARDVLCFMYCVNPAHVLAHLPNARKELDNWMASIG